MNATHTRPFLIKTWLPSALCLLVLLAGGHGRADDLFQGFDQQVTDTGFNEPLIEIRSVLSISQALPGTTCLAATVVRLDSVWHINSATPHEEWLVPTRLEFDTIDGVTPHSIVYPPGHDAFLADMTMSVYSFQAVIKFSVSIDEDLPAGSYVLPVRLTYQSCNDVECLPPVTVDADLAVAVGANGTPVAAELFGSDPPDLRTEAPPPDAAPSDNDLQRLIDDYGFWGYFIALGLAFVTGLLLSFSPCTYPMIPITVSVFAGQKRGVLRGFVMSLFYVGSMAVVYGLMGLIVASVGGVFGAWLASPPVVIGIAVVLVIFALSMFGLYELQVPGAIRQKLGSTRGSGGVAGAMLLGVIAALVVSPCVGPFVAGILLYVATSGSPMIGFLVLFVFAVGLGTLYILIGTFSSAIEALPGSGEWMESVKKFFGFVLLLMALYFLRTIIPPSLTAVLAGLLLIAYGVFGGGLDRLSPESAFFIRLKKSLGVLALLVGGYLLVGSLVTQGLILPPVSQWWSGGTAATEHEASLIDWETDLMDALTRAQAEGKPVLIDTWATWCANCRVLDEKTFGNADVAREAERFVAVKVQLETADSPATKDFMTRFNLKHYSLPTTLLLEPNGTVRRILRGVVPPDDMLAEMRKLP